MDYLLECRLVEKRFGGVQAVAGCSLGVPPGSITGLIGPNGAGKTTLFHLIAGLFKPDAGEVTFDGQRIDGLPPHVIYHRRLARTFQIPRELRDMTVLENMMLFPTGQVGESLFTTLLTPGRVWRQEAEVREKAEALLRFVELHDLRDELARNLSGGQKKLLELARTLMNDPKMILLDEPGAGVNPTLMEKLSEDIKALQERGTTFLLVEHDMDVITRLCDQVVVMARGEVLTSGTFDEIRQDERVLNAYLAG